MPNTHRGRNKADQHHQSPALLHQARRFPLLTTSLLLLTTLLAIIFFATQFAPDNSHNDRQTHQNYLITEHNPNQPSDPDQQHACRFWGMIGPLTDTGVIYDNLISSDRSLKSLGNNNPNGWGLTYFAQDLIDAGYTDPIILRGGPKASNEFDPRLGKSVLTMNGLTPNVIVAHIRNASSGHDDVPDPHPFYRDGILFCHNGSVNRTKLIAAINADDPEYLNEHPVDYEDPNIDSELYFTFVRKIHKEGQAGPRLADAIAEAIFQMYTGDMISNAANCLASDGDTLYAVRFDHNESSTFAVKYKNSSDGWLVASQETDSENALWKTMPPKSLGIFTPGNEPEFISIFPPNGPWITRELTLIDDDTTAPSNGNDDGIINGGEVIELSLQLKNIGSETATNVQTSIVIDEPLCEILSGASAYPDLEADSTSLPDDPFVLSFSSEITSLLTIPCTLKVNSSEAGRQTSWEIQFTLTVHSPDVHVETFTVIDGNNGHIEPGETFDFQITLKNYGASSATNLIGTMTTETPQITITQAVAQIDSLEVREVEDLMPAFTVSVAPEFPFSGLAALDLDLVSDWGYHAQTRIDLPIGGFFDNMENGQGDWTHTHLLTGFTDAWHLSTQANHTPEGQYSWHCGDEDPEAPYPGLLDAVLYTPVVTLDSNAQLSFWHRIYAEDYGILSSARDGGLVEMSINGGPWQQIFSEDGYTHVIDYNEDCGPFPEGTPVFSGYNPDWSREVYNLQWVSGDIQFRFRFGSNQETGYEGWFIDDVVVIGFTDPAALDDQDEQSLTTGLSLSNPSLFRHNAMICYTVAEPGEIKLNILDLQGRVIRRLIDEYRPVGRHKLVWDGQDDHGRPVASGLYFYLLRSAADKFEDSRRVIRIR